MRRLAGSDARYSVRSLQYEVRDCCEATSGARAPSCQHRPDQGQRDIAVIGCGALGLTSATLLQRAGARVTIYAEELPPNVRSSLATGMWTPSSRICLEPYATPSLKKLWESMARRSFDTYQTWLGLPGTPVEFFEFYEVEDAGPAPIGTVPAEDPRPKFADLEGDLLGDLETKTEKLGPGSRSFGDRTLYGSERIGSNEGSVLSPGRYSSCS